jgi:hypothetical protein
MLNTREKWQIQCGWCIVFVAASELPVGGSQYDILIQRKNLDFLVFVVFFLLGDYLASCFNHPKGRKLQKYEPRRKFES